MAHAMTSSISRSTVSNAVRRVDIESQPNSSAIARPEDCFHCGLALQAGSIFTAELSGEQRSFCCPACRLVAQTIIESGLEDFYRHAKHSGVAVEAELVSADYSLFDTSEFQARNVTVSPLDNRAAAKDKSAQQLSYQTQLLVGGMHCAACVWLLEKYLSALPGVERVSVNLSEQRATLVWNPAEITLSQIATALAQLGYEPQPYNSDQLQTLRSEENRLALRRLGIAGIGMMQVGMYAIALYAGALQGIDEHYSQLLRWVSWIVATPVILYSALPFFIGAWRGLKSRMPGMDLPVALAMGLAYLASVKATLMGVGEVYFDSVVMFTFFLLTGRYLEMLARHRGAKAVSGLDSLLPASVSRLVHPDQEESFQTISLEQLQVGDHILVKPGQVIAADGVIKRGASCVNEAQLSGEFMPLQKQPGDKVYAGTINENNALLIVVTATAETSRLQQISQLLDRAHSSKPRISQLADRYASHFVQAVLLLALVTFTSWWLIDADFDKAFWITLSVLVVSCPCALSLATPAALTAANNVLRKYGLLVSNGEIWEKSAQLTDVVCDKTGTLTEGVLTVRRAICVGSLSEAQCLNIAIALEQYSEHPIASAFKPDSLSSLTDVSFTPECIELRQVTVEQNKGIEAELDQQCYRIGKPGYVQSLFEQALIAPECDGQWILLGSSSGPLCWFQLEDRPRQDAKDFILALKRQGLKTHLLSGDQSSVVGVMGRRFNFDRWKGGVSPEDKYAYIKKLQSEGRHVLMLGDGLNDLPVLATADISVAMTNASDLAKFQADVISMSPRLSSTLEMLEIAGKVRRVIRENLLWALSYNLLAIPIAALGLVPPYLAALGMSLSSLIVIANSLQLQRQSASAGSPPVNKVGVAYG